MKVLFESHDNDFSECLLNVVQWFASRVSEYNEEKIRKWLLTDDAAETLSEAFAATVYAKDCADVALDVRKDGVRKSPPVTLENRRQYLGKLKISIVDRAPDGGDNGESVLWDGEEIYIV